MNTNRKGYAYIRISNGLGNQLFKYAAARSLSLRTSKKLVLEVGGFERDPFKREYLLDCFQGPQQQKKVRLTSGLSRYPARLFADLGRRFPSKLYRVYTDRPIPSAFCEGVLNAPEYLVDLDGLWQSEDYFLAYREQVLEDLKFNFDPPAPIIKWRETIEGEKDSVAVHIRRYTDVANPSARPVLNSEYYKRALLRISEELPGARLFVFTDDLDDEVYRIVDGHPVTVVDVNQGGGNVGGLHDFYLMAHCKHFVVANSSFSWWACWLSQNKWGMFSRDSQGQRGRRMAFFPTEKLYNERFIPAFATHLED